VRQKHLFTIGDGFDGWIPDPFAIAQTMLGKGSRGVVIKMGVKGVYLASRDGLAQALPAIAVKAVDTTAAGDAFNGGFATALMLGKTPIESARFAAVVAGLSVTRTGARSSMPAIAEVNEFMKQGRSPSI
jgi:ribokinase